MITVIGHDGGPLRPEARTALARATCVAGVPRHLDALPVPETAHRIDLTDVASALDTVTGAAPAGPRDAASIRPAHAGTGDTAGPSDTVAGNPTGPPETTAGDSARSRATGAGHQAGLSDAVPVTGSPGAATGDPASTPRAVAATTPDSSGAEAGGDTNAHVAGAEGAADTRGAVPAGRAYAVVVASGDPGFFGIVRALRARGAEPRVIPAVSSVALAFAALGLPWDDALVVSAHGRSPRRALAAALAHPKTAILTAPGTAGPAYFIGALLAAGRRVHVAERLGMPDERVTEVTAGHAAADGSSDTRHTDATRGHVMHRNGVIASDPDRATGDLDRRTGQAGAPDVRARNEAAYSHPNVLITYDPARAVGERGRLAGHQGAPDGWALPESAYDHRDGQVTKAEVRALALARLAPRPGVTVWDVGAGSGSVAAECARFGAHAIAVERDPDQCARVRANAARHGAYVQVVTGSAPDALADLPDPDAVFVGGGDAAVLDAVLRRAPARVVVVLASIDRVRPVRDALRAAGYPPGGCQLQSGRLADLPNGSIRLDPANPVTLVWGAAP